MAKPTRSRSAKSAKPATTAKQTKRQKPSAPPSPRRQWFWPAVKWTVVAAIWLTVGIGGLVVWYAADLPDVDAALTAPRRPAITIVAADGTELATVGERYGLPVQVQDLPPALPLAVIATEDRRFYDHFGVDLFGVARAMVANLRAGAFVQGGSTITQQAAKNLFLTPERTLKRKIQELLLAFWLEHKFSKNEILAIYLNRVYFGSGTFGVDAAARRYFGRPASSVSTYQSALLAGLLKAPSRYNPLSNPHLAEARANQVLVNMVAAGLLSADEANAARRHRGSMVTALGHRYGDRYFVDWILSQAPDFVPAGDRDLIITTTLDAHLQRLAEQRLEKTLAAPGASVGAGQGALVALSPDGAVRAMVGGRNYAESQFNRATQAYRQPGSAFKPFVYLAGLEAGLEPDSRMNDAPIAIDGWRPGNFSGRYVGEVTLRQALAQSINTVAVRVSEAAGRTHVIDAAHRLGITADLRPMASVALGAGEVSLLELTAAYGVFANGGFGIWPYGIEAIYDGYGHLLYTRSGSGPGRLIELRHAASITQMLAGAVDAGTGRAAALGARPVAGKTGTSQNYRDAWFIGFTADLIAGVWVGNDGGEAMRNVTGGGLPAKLWRSFMADAHEGLPIRPLPSLVAPPQQPEIVTAETTVSDNDEPSFWQRLLSVFGGD